MKWLLNGLDLNHCRINQHKYFTNCRYRLTYGKWYDWALRNHSWITTWNILSPDNCWLQWTLTDRHGILILLICLVICLNKLGLIWGSYWKLDDISPVTYPCSRCVCRWVRKWFTPNESDSVPYLQAIWCLTRKIAYELQCQWPFQGATAASKVHSV